MKTQLRTVRNSVKRILKRGRRYMMADGDVGTELVCPICGGDTFIDYRRRKNARCAQCGALERSRVLWMAYDALGLGGIQGKVLHFAPEKCISDKLAALPSIDYQPRDIDPSLFANYPKPVLPFDLCSDASALEPESIAGVVHSHVFEHLPCNVYKVFLDLNRAIRPGGYHLFIVPFFGPYFSEDLSPLTTDEQRTERFGQFDHVRAFGTEDFDRLFLGAFEGFDQMDVASAVPAEKLARAAVSGRALRVRGGNYVMCFKKRA